jgi:hypothetical protein
MPKLLVIMVSLLSLVATGAAPIVVLAQSLCPSQMIMTRDGCQPRGAAAPTSVLPGRPGPGPVTSTPAVPGPPGAGPARIQPQPAKSQPAPITAYAADWFEGAYCDDDLDRCFFPKECRKADKSPAQLYENNRARGADIVEKADDRVEVIGYGVKAHWVFFRNADSCQRYVDEERRTIEQTRKNEQEKLNKYR